MTARYSATPILWAGLLLSSAGCSTSMAKSPPSRDEVTGKAPDKPTGTTLPAAMDSRATSATLADNRCPASSFDGAERDLLRSLRQRVDELQAREAAVTRREADVAGLEERWRTRLEPRFEEVRKLEERLGIAKPSTESHNARLEALAETLRPMSARKAAPILASADLAIAVSLLQRLGTDKASALLAQMEPTQAARLVEQVAREAAPKERPPEAKTGPSSGSAHKRGGKR